jgi:hypothetical protein
VAVAHPDDRRQPGDDHQHARRARRHDRRARLRLPADADTSVAVVRAVSGARRVGARPDQRPTGRHQGADGRPVSR